MASKETELEQLVWLIRRLFRQLAQESDLLLTDFGINARERAILEFLGNSEPETIGAIADRHRVSRQHIQQSVNSLVSKGLAKTQDNPAHKRAYLVQRTAKGKRLFQQVSQLESSLYKAIAADFSGASLQQANQTMSQLLKLFNSDKWQDIKSSIEK